MFSTDAQFLVHHGITYTMSSLYRKIIVDLWGSDQWKLNVICLMLSLKHCKRKSVGGGSIFMRVAPLNGKILLIFKIWKKCIQFVPTWFNEAHVLRLLYEDDIIIVTSHVQSVQYFPHWYSFPTYQVLDVIKSYQKNEHVQQWNLRKCKPSVSTYQWFGGLYL